MPISGLVVTLSPPWDHPPGQSPASPRDHASDHADASGVGHESVIEQIRNHPHLQPGPRQDLRLPVVVDTPDRETDKACWRWLNDLPGVHHVDVAFIHFEDDDPVATSCFNANQDNNLIAGPTIRET